MRASPAAIEIPTGISIISRASKASIYRVCEANISHCVSNISPVCGLCPQRYKFLTEFAICSYERDISLRDAICAFGTRTREFANTKISASACGYPAQSTFYRVFKKYYGESPNKYRSLH